MPGEHRWSVDQACKMAQTLVGWMHDVELRQLARWATDLPKGARWLETGCWCGRSTTATALCLPPEAELVLIDDYSARALDARPDLKKAAVKGNQILTPWWPAELLQMTIRALRERRPDISIVFHNRPVLEVVPELVAEGQQFDRIFVDDDHEGSYVAKELVALEPLARTPQSLSGHDYQRPEWAGVANAVDQYAAGRNRKVVVNRTIWSLT